MVHDYDLSPVLTEIGMSPGALANHPPLVLDSVEDVRVGLLLATSYVATSALRASSGTNYRCVLNGTSC